MPKYAIEPDKYEGAIDLPFWPCDFMDANGNFLNGKAHYVDTDNGIAIGVVIENGIPKEYQSNLAYGFVLLVEVHPAPLQIVPYDPNRHITPIIVGGS